MIKNTIDTSINIANGSEVQTLYQMQAPEPLEVRCNCIVPFESGPTLEAEENNGKQLSRGKGGRFESREKTTFPYLLQMGVKESIDYAIEPVKVGTMGSCFYAPNVQPVFYINTGKSERLKDNYKAGGLKAIWNEVKGNKEFLSCVSKWSLASNSLFVADMCTGILRALTGGAAYNNFFVNIDDSDKDFIKLIATPLQLAKAGFGGCMTTDGLKTGMYEPLEKAGIIKIFIELLAGPLNSKTSEGREPALNYIDENGVPVRYRPIIFREINGNGVVKAELDRRYFAIRENKGKAVYDGRFISTFAGLYSICAVGKYYLSKENPERSLPRASSVAKLYHALQASFNIQSLIGFSRTYEVSAEDKNKKTVAQIRLNDTAAYTLFPSHCKLNRNWLDWKKISQVVADAGQILYKGLEVTGLLEANLPGAENLLLIKQDRASWFEDRAFYVGCESLADIQKEKRC